MEPHRGSDERVAEADAAAVEQHQPRLLGRGERRDGPRRAFEHRGGRERRSEVAACVERGDEEGRARGPWQLVDPLGNRPLEPFRERQVDRGEVERGLRQLEQRQQVPVRELEHLRTGARRQPRRVRVEESARALVVEPGELQLREPRGVDTDRPGRPAR